MEGSSVPREEATLPPPPYIYIVSAKDETRELARIELKRGEQGLLVEELLKRTDFDAITLRTNRGYKLASHQWVERGQVVRLESIDECSVLCGETRIQVPISREQAVHVSPISIVFSGNHTVVIGASKNLTRKKAIEEACKKDGNLIADDWICHPGLNEEEECTPGDMFVVIRIKKNEMNEDS